MLKTSKTHYPYEHYGDISVDFGSTYWEKLTRKYIDTSLWRPIGFKFIVDTKGKFTFYIWASPLNSETNENGEYPVKKFKTEITWDEFSKSFVKLTAQAFWGRQPVDNFYNLEDE